MRTRKANNKPATPIPPKKAAVKAGQKATPKAQRAPETPVEEQEGAAKTSPGGNAPETAPDAESSKSMDAKSGEAKNETVGSVSAEEGLDGAAKEGLEGVAVPMEEDKDKKSLDEKNPKEIPAVPAEDLKEETCIPVPDIKDADGASTDIAMKEAKIEVHPNGDLEGGICSEELKQAKVSTEEEEAKVDNDGEANCAEEETKQVQKNDEARNQADSQEADVAEKWSESQQTMPVSDRQRRKKMEVFVGGLDKEATEEDLRKVFEKVGEITEIRLMKNFETGKNKGYAFVRYTSSAEAKRAVKELSKTQIRGKQCGVVPLEENDTIFLGNIDKKWNKDDVIKMLKEIGIENIHNVTVIDDPHNVGHNRGFAFLELETYKDAQIAYKKMQKKDAFGKDKAIKVAWAQPLNDPDEDVMAQVKSVFVDGLPPSWNEEQVKEYFGKFGEIERVVLARNMQSAKRKDFGFVNYTTREAATACIDIVNKADGLIEGDLKVKVKVSLAKPVQKAKIGKGDSKGTNKGDSKGNAKNKEGHVLKSGSKNTSKASIVRKGLPGKGGLQTPSSTTHEILQVLREQAAWRQGSVAITAGHNIGNFGSVQLGNAGVNVSGLERAQLSGVYLGGHDQAFRVPYVQPVTAVQEYAQVAPGFKRAYTALGEEVYVDSRGHPRPRLETSAQAGGSSHGWSTREHASLLNPMVGGSLQQQFYQYPGVGAAVGSLFPTGSIASASSGLKVNGRLSNRPTKHAARKGGRGGSARSSTRN